MPDTANPIGKVSGDSLLLTAPEAAQYLRVKADTLANWRSRGQGPSFCKLGDGRIVYRFEDLKVFVERSRRAIA